VNGTEVIQTHTSGTVLCCLHADGGVSLLRGGPGNAECFLSASRAGWELIVDQMTPKPDCSAHDSIAWIEEQMGSP
jgi:hypothetical protein